MSLYTQFADLLRVRYGITPSDVGIESDADLNGDTPEEAVQRLAEKYDLIEIDW